MKRIISVAMVCLACLGLGAVSVCAEDEAMTRLEAVMFIEECMSSEIDENYAELNPFNDAPEGAEACLGYAYGKNLVNGTGDNLFVPEREVTREEFLMMALRLIGGERAAWKCNAYVSAFVSAYVAGIYDYTDDIDASFTLSEAETIMARVFALERYSATYFPNVELSGELAQKAEEERAQLSEYRKTLSSLYTSYDAVYYLNELSEKTIFFEYHVGSPHGNSAVGYVINKSDGTYGENLPLYSPYWAYLMPDKIWVSDDEKTLYYSTDSYKSVAFIVDNKEDGFDYIMDRHRFKVENVLEGTYTCEVNLDTMEVIKTYIAAEAE